MSESTIEFKTAAQEKCYRRVVEYVRELFGEDARADDERPSFSLTNGSATIRISVYPWGTNDSYITVGAWVILGVKMVPSLMLFLLRENYQVACGGFGIDKEDDIFFEHSIVGSTCDQAELSNSVAAVGVYADKYDDEIQRLWGGKKPGE